MLSESTYVAPDLQTHAKLYCL